MQQFTIDPRYTRDLSRRIDAICTRVETQRKVIITDTVRNFLAAIILESVIFRYNEWSANYNINTNQPADVARTIGIALDSVEKIFGNAPTDTFRGNEYIILAGILQSIHNNWCGIFPICR